jgi:hypothetical protein
MDRAMPGWRYSWRYRKTISAELFASNYPGVSQWAIGPLDVGRASRPADQRLLKGDRARPECRRGLKSLTEAATKGFGATRRAHGDYSPSMSAIIFSFDYQS